MVAAVGDDPGRCVELAEFGAGTLDDLLEPALFPPDLRSLDEGTLDVEADELEPAEWVAFGIAETDTVILLVEPAVADEEPLRFE